MTKAQEKRPRGRTAVGAEAEQTSRKSPSPGTSWCAADDLVLRAPRQCPREDQPRGTQYLGEQPLPWAQDLTSCACTRPSLGAQDLSVRVSVHVGVHPAISQRGHQRCGCGWGRSRHLPTSRAHLALAVAVGLVAVGIKAFADGTVARSAHGVPPPAFGARKVNPVGETGEQRDGVRNRPRSQRKMSEARSLTWSASGLLPAPE